jgi:hypothetical protein
MSTSQATSRVQEAPDSLQALWPTAKVALLDAPVLLRDTIVSFDPGRTTGIVVAKGSTWIAIETPELATIWRLLHAYRPRTILFEAFHADNPAANDEALDVRGIVKLYRALITKPKIPPMIYWQPREAKGESGVASSRCLRANGLWIPGKPHRRDALAHLIWHLINRENYTQLLEWTKPKID